MVSSMQKFLLPLVLLLCCTVLPLRAQYAAGEQVPESYLKAHGHAAFFQVTPIPDNVFARMQGKSYKAGCPVRRSQLRYLRCLHRTAEGHALVGEMVLHEQIADDVLDILRQLFEAHYPIERMRLIDDYDGNDNCSMAANNTSAFNYRKVAGKSALSRHAYGMAVDINPLYNPYVCQRNGRRFVDPKGSEPYADRTRKHPYMIRRDDLCHRLFRAKGFRWGGDWKYSKDYQHFDKK